MDWTLFWTAFGAIGTTVGSFITAIAVVIAVKQYKEPLIKRLKIKLSFGYLMGEIPNRDWPELLIISVSNAGIRPINISNIYLAVGKKSLVLNHSQFSVPRVMPPIIFPVELHPEQKVEMYLLRDKLVDFFAGALSDGTFTASAAVQILVTDQTGGEHYQKTGFSVKNFANNSFE